MSTDRDAAGEILGAADALDTPARELLAELVAIPSPSGRKAPPQPTSSRSSNSTTAKRGSTMSVTFVRPATTRSC
nr:hypothetical protein [Halolamina pelagica]